MKGRLTLVQMIGITVPSVARRKTGAKNAQIQKSLNVKDWTMRTLQEWPGVPILPVEPEGMPGPTPEHTAEVEPRWL